MIQFGLPWDIRLSQDLDEEFDHLKKYVEEMEYLLVKEKENIEDNPPDILQDNSNDEIYRMYLEGIADQHYLKIDRYENAFPQIVRTSFLINLWSLLEMHLKGLAEVLKSEANIPIKLNDLRGDLLTRTKHYFERLGNINLTVLPEWEVINNLQDIRNYLTHKTEFTFLNTNWDKVKSFIENHPELILYCYVDRIEIKDAFCNYALDNIRNFLFSLLNQIKERVNN